MRFYQMLDAEDQLAITVRDGEHGWSPVEYAMILDCFNRAFEYRPATMSWEESMTRCRMTPDDCLVTATGNIYREGYSSPDETVRAEVADANEPDEEWLEVQLAAIKPSAVVWEEIDRYRIGDGVGRRIVFTPTEGIILPAEVLVPPQPQGIAVLLDEISRLEAIDWQMSVASGGLVAVRPDLRGFGETTPPDDWPEGENWYRPLYNGKRYTLHATAALCGRHLVLDRAADVLALLQVIEQMGLSGPVTVWGRRSGAIVALFTALALPSLSELILESAPVSYQSLLDCELPCYHTDYTVFNLLQAGFDIPRLCARVPGKVTWRNPNDLCRS